MGSRIKIIRQFELILDSNFQDGKLITFVYSFEDFESPLSNFIPTFPAGHFGK